MPVPHAADLRVGVKTQMQSAAVATGNGTAITLTGGRRAAFDLNGITTATVTWEGSLDGTNYRGISLESQAGTRAATATADGIYMLPPEFPPMVYFRGRISAYTSGTINLIGLASN